MNTDAIEELRIRVEKQFEDKKEKLETGIVCPNSNLGVVDFIFCKSTCMGKGCMYLKECYGDNSK